MPESLDRKRSSPVASPALRSQRISVWLIVLVAFALRLAVITVGHTYRITPRGDHFQFGWETGRIARSLALGQGFGNPTDLQTGPTAWEAPAYAYILAGVFRVFGIYSRASAWVILAFNSVFGALTCYTLYLIGRRIYGEGVARATAWTWAVFPYAIYWPVRVVWETALSTFLLSLGLLLTLQMAEEPPTWKKWAWFGGLWGLIALTNPSLLSALPFFLGWLIYRLPGRRKAILGAVLCLFLAGLIVTPWLIRNYEVFGRFIFIRDNLALELHMANNDESSSGMWTRSEHPANSPEAMREFQELGELHFMREKGKQFRAFLQAHPGEFVRSSLVRVWYFWAGTPQISLIGSWDLIVARHTTFLIVSLMAFAGFWLTVRNRRPGSFLLAVLLFVLPLPYYLVMPFPRYKHPIEPAMILLIVYLFWEARKVQIRWPGTR